MKKVKPKICPVCGKPFTPTHSTTQKVCSPICALELVRKNPPKSFIKALKQKERLANKEAKEKTLTHSDWLNLFQKVFNTYIRMRDKNKPCISCDRPLVGKFDAGHFYSVKPYYGLRFHEDNVHGQCVFCNQHMHGNQHEYAIRLPFRIGYRNFKWLEENRHIEQKLTIPDLKELIKEYKDRIKTLSLQQHGNK